MKFALVLAVLSVCLASVPAHAQATRTWVSGVGDDANPCSRTAPCKTFPGAISKTAAGGQINVLDPGGFGAVTITKAITINSEFIEAGVLVSGTNAIIISAGANDRVVLRGLDIEGLGTGLSGIRFLAGGSLHVQKCTIRNFRGGTPNGHGILFAPSGTSELFVDDCNISSNGTDGTNGGITIRPTGGGSATAVLNRVFVENNTNGITVDGDSTTGQIRVSIRDSYVAGNSANGIFSNDVAAGLTVRTFVTDTLVANNGNGIQARGTGQQTIISNVAVTGNQNGLFGGGALLSFSNNPISGNTNSDGNPTGTVAPK
jgi:hypothetical protein